MLNDIKQVELDLAEEKVLTAIFGSTTPNAKAQWLLNFMGINLQEMVDKFEFFAKPMMNEQGLIDAKLARELVGEKYPFLANIVPDEDFRLVEVADSMVNVIDKLLKGMRK